MDRKLLISIIVSIVIVLAIAVYFFTQKPRDTEVLVEQPVVEEPKPVLYVGNNGTVSGDAYCAGPWGSFDGVSTKNLKCVEQRDAVTGELLECGSSYATYQNGLRPTDNWCI